MKKRIVLTLDLAPDLLDLESLPPEVTLEGAAAAAVLGVIRVVLPGPPID